MFAQARSAGLSLTRRRAGDDQSRRALPGAGRGIRPVRCLLYRAIYCRRLLLKRGPVFPVSQTSALCVWRAEASGRRSEDGSKGSAAGWNASNAPCFRGCSFPPSADHMSACCWPGEWMGPGRVHPGGSRFLTRPPERRARKQPRRLATRPTVPRRFSSAPGSEGWGARGGLEYVAVSGGGLDTCAPH